MTPSLPRLLAAFFPLVLLTGSAFAQPADVRFEDEVIPSGTYTASTSITARDATIPSGSAVTFRAGQTVRLEAGFKVETGATFRAEVDPDVGSGGGSPGSIVLSQMPNALPNGRFFADQFEVQRPALTLHGFDSPDYTGDDHGYGLKQVLEIAYEEDELVFPVYSTIIEMSNEALQDPFDPPSGRSARGVINDNSAVVQSRAFVALATYILEQNGNALADYQITPGPPDPTSELYVPSHAEALADLKAALLSPPGGDLFADDGDPYGADRVKWTRSFGNFARALDLYLALENAYFHFDHPDYDDENASTLLTRSDKESLLRSLCYGIERLTAKGLNGRIAPNDAEPGNRPMKMFVAAGYGILTSQDIEECRNFHTTAEPFNPARTADGVLQDAFLSAGAQASQDRRLHWSYQSDGGKRFWAEGAYYLEFALLDVLPFWHALRANDLLAYQGGGFSIDLPDPFQNDWALNPLRWLADTVTPDAKTMPLDDGNKVPIRYANLMRWAPEYGDAELGEKFAWIHEERGGPANPTSRDPSTLLNEIATPRTAATQAPLSEVVNTAPPYNNSEQQLVVRRDNGTGACNQISRARTGDCHYVVLNGEHGDAIVRGEGHEQPDNMQLLYYVNGTSVLMDSGYDDAEFPGNSTWNHYYDHNVLNFGYGEYEYYDFNGIEGNPFEGGLNPPFTYGPATRKVADHADINRLFARTQGKLTQLQAWQFLSLEPVSDIDPPLYKRDVLFVDGAEPYLVDMNRITHNFSDEARDRYKFRMNYYANDLSLQIPKPWSLETVQPVKWPNVDGSGQGLYLFPMAIEYPLLEEDVNAVRDITREPNNNAGELNTAGDDVIVRRLDLYDYARRHNDQYSSFASTVQLRQGDPANIPQLIRTHSRQYVDPWMGWIWQQDPNTIDVFIVRSTQRRLIEPVAFNLKDTNVAFPDFSLVLPEDRVYGFARIEKRNGVWSRAEDYQLSFEIPELMVQLDGPHAVASGASATWTARAYGGSGLYAYRWLAGPDPNDLQDTGDTEAEYTRSADADFYLQVEVTSGSETAPSEVRRVYVGRPAPPSDLELLNPDEIDQHPHFAWLPSPTPDVSYRLTRCEGSTPGCGEAKTTLFTHAEDEAVTIQDACPGQYNTSYYVTALGTLGESDPTNEIEICATAPVTSAEAVARQLEAASGVTLEAVPDDYALEAAYPNPFNPQATIRFALPEAAEVRLVVYDVVGREVARLVEGQRSAGYHAARFDGARLASGLYLYRLTARGEAGAFSKTGRMVLVK